MSKPQYRRAHQAERERWRPTVEAGQAYCVEPICLELRDGRGRWIHPLSKWHLCHDAATGAWLGPGHPRCNIAESNRRNAKKRATGQSHWLL